MEPLQKFMEKVYEKELTRTKSGVSKILLSVLGWSKVDKKVFKNAEIPWLIKLNCPTGTSNPSSAYKIMS